MAAAAPILMVFVDGLGVGPDDPAINPIHGGACPVLEGLIERHGWAIDACLGVAGLPQSATGQTALLTGVNAPAWVGRHIEGFPGEALRTLIRASNIFAQFVRRGRRATFANAYFIDSGDDPARRRIQSVTTVAALSAFGDVRRADAMLRGEAVYQDLTRESLRERGYGGPLVSPGQSAGHLAALAAAHDFTLFEYFQTDRAGHSGDPERARAVLGQLDGLFAALVPRVEALGVRLVVTSDHGNIEDMRVRTHTSNPVPFVALGKGAAALRGSVRSLTDVTPALLRWAP